MEVEGYGRCYISMAYGSIERRGDTRVRRMTFVRIVETRGETGERLNSHYAIIPEYGSDSPIKRFGREGKVWIRNQCSFQLDEFCMY